MAEDHADDWFGPDAATFGDRLAAAREQAGMSSSEFAKRLGVKKSTMASWEQDLSEPRANRLSMMAGLLNVSIPWLLTGEGDGLDGPVGEDELPADINELLLEIRDIKGQVARTSDRLGRLEKKLRVKLKELGV